MVAEDASPRRRARRAIEQALEVGNASAALRRLVRWKCERAAVISLLVNITFIDPRFNDLRFWTGRSRVQVTADIQQIRKAAARVEALLDKPLKAVVVGAAGTRPIARTLSLPADLRRLADLLQELLDEVSGRKHLQQDLAIAALVRYVYRTTGRWHDPEVSALVSAVLSPLRATAYSYSPEVHQRWRRQNYSRLAEALD